MQASNRVTEGAPVERVGLGARVLGVLTSPRETFERVMADPRWIGILVLGVGGVAVLSSAFVSTEFAQRSILDQQIASMEASGQPASDDVFAPTLGDDTFACNLLSVIDLFHVWWVMILAIGLAVLWKRRTGPIAATLYGIHAGIALIIAVLRTNIGF